MKRRRTDYVDLSAHPLDFAPAHCAGTNCLHAHRGEPALPVFATVDEPVVRCNRKVTHGSHDITRDDGDYRCPGLLAAWLPAPEVTRRVGRVRAAIRGGS